jgi:hypothetical protein
MVNRSPSGNKTFTFKCTACQREPRYDIVTIHNLVRVPVPTARTPQGRQDYQDVFPQHSARRFSHASQKCTMTQS